MASIDPPTFSEPHIKGSIIRSSRDWMIRTYGRPVYDRALARLEPDHAELIEGELVSVGWYPLSAWSAFTRAMRAEVKSATGEDEAVFDRRNIFEGGRQTLVKVYRFVLSFLDPLSVVTKLTPVYRRVYSHGSVDVLSHAPGRLVVRFGDAPVAMQEEVTRAFPLSIEFMLHLAGQSVTKIRPVGKVQSGKFWLELEVSYEKAS